MGEVNRKNEDALIFYVKLFSRIYIYQLSIYG